MHSTVTIDDTLHEYALQLADPVLDKAEPFREVFRTYVRVQSAKRLAALRGAAPRMPDIERRREVPAR
jgi:hypothetical protein